MSVMKLFCIPCILMLNAYKSVCLRCIFQMGGVCGLPRGFFLQVIWLLACLQVLCEYFPSRD